jgi:hypothetical protein
VTETIPVVSDAEKADQKIYKYYVQTSDFFCACHINIIRNFITECQLKYKTNKKKPYKGDICEKRVLFFSFFFFSFFFFPPPLVPREN